VLLNESVALCAVAERQDRSLVFRWAREQEPPRCAYWMMSAGCPHVKKGAAVTGQYHSSRMPERVHGLS
jgi:hypothetical protein